MKLQHDYTRSSSVDHLSRGSMKALYGDVPINYLASEHCVWRIRAAIGSLALCFLAIGCAGSNGSGTINIPPGLPIPAPPSTANNYIGTQSPGLWSLTLDDTQDAFSYQALTYPSSPNIPTSGNFIDLAGYIDFAQPGAQSNGYALEIPSRAVILRPGANTVPPVLAVQQSSCFPIGGNVTFQFVYIPTGTQPTGGPGSVFPTYGTVAAGTNVDGSSWSFGGQVLYQFPFTLGAPGATTVPPNTPSIATNENQAGYLPTFTATCSVTSGQAMIAAPANVNSFNSGYTVSTNYFIGSSGFFIEDQSPTTKANAQPAPPAAVGVVRPSAPLTTSSVVAETYLGFIYENGLANGVQITTTSPIGFGQVVVGSGTTMSGAVFANDDVTQIPLSPVIPSPIPGAPPTGGTPLANVIINLGAQDSVNNGLYPLATITIPDPTQRCVPNSATGNNSLGIPGQDASGNETCTFNAVAVVGNPENKYAIFISSYDATTGVPMGMYLFQQ